MKPNDFRQPFTIAQEVPYRVQEGDLKGTHSSSGSLAIGRVVWVREMPKDDEPDQRVLVYAEGVGVVSIEAHFLRSSSRKA